MIYTNIIFVALVEGRFYSYSKNIFEFRQKINHFTLVCIQLSVFIWTIRKTETYFILFRHSLIKKKVLYINSVGMEYPEKWLVPDGLVIDEGPGN